MDADSKIAMIGHSGQRAHLYSHETGEEIGILFVYEDDTEKFARFVRFNEKRGVWCFSELPEAFTYDTDNLVSLRSQLNEMGTTFLLHSNDRAYFIGPITKPRYVQ